MTLARVTTWADGQTLTAAALNGEFDNIINNPNSLVTQTYGTSRVSGLIGSVSTNVGTFAANQYTFRSTSQGYSIVATSSYDINTQTVGPAAGGRDQAAAFAGTTVHFYAISTGPNSTAPAGVCSTNGPSVGPTMPTNYSGWSYLTSIRYTVAASAATNNVMVRGSRVYSTAGGLFGSLTSTNHTGTVTDGTPMGGSLSIPTGVTHLGMYATYGLLPGSTGGASVGTYDIFSATSGPVLHTFSLTLGSTATAYTGAATKITSAPFSLPTFSATPTLAYGIQIVSGTSGTLFLVCNDYTVPNGDVG